MTIQDFENFLMNNGIAAEKKYYPWGTRYCRIKTKVEWHEQHYQWGTRHYKTETKSEWRVDLHKNGFIEEWEISFKKGTLPRLDSEYDSIDEYVFWMTMR